MMIRFDKILLFIGAVLFLLLPFHSIASAQSSNQKQFIYDYANVLSSEEKLQLESLSSRLSEERNTAFLIITLNGTGNQDIVEYMKDFYDDQAPGYNKKHGNTAMLLIDLQERDVFLSAFKKGKLYLGNNRLTKIRETITPDLSAGNYYDAFNSYLNLSHEYMGYEPDNIFFKWWFQLIVSMIVAGIIVTIMAYRSGGKVTVSAKDYLNSGESSVIEQRDQYVRTTVTKVKKPSNKGGKTGGGHSFSGSRGKF